MPTAAEREAARAKDIADQAEAQAAQAQAAADAAAAAEAKVAQEKADAVTKHAAHRALFETVHAAIKQLEVGLGMSQREARVGPLGEFVALLSSAASEGLQLIARNEP
jgi:membrane protein involved in colicin uptake